MRKRLKELSWVLLSLSAELEGSEFRGLKKWDKRLSQGQAEQGEAKQVSEVQLSRTKYEVCNIVA